MIYKIDKNSKEPSYMQLYRFIRQDIVNNLYKYGEKLPSKRVISSENGVSVITTQHALELLCDEGYIEARQRSGYFVIYSNEDCFPVANDYVERERPVYNSMAAEFPFSVYSKTIRRVLSEYGDSLFIKSQNKGCKELRKAIASYLGRSRGVKVEPRQIVIGSGAEYLYSTVVQILGHERVVAIENPSYEKIKNVYISNGVRVEALEMGSDGIKTSELKKAEATVLHVTPFNSFPSGVTATASKRNEYARWAREKNGFIIEDDYDSEFTLSMKAADTLYSLAPERTIYINTFSKTIAPSVRIGYMVLPKELLEAYKERVGFYSCTVPILEQYALAEIIENGDFERHINRVRRKRRNAD